MSVLLLVHLERVEDADPGFVWWADSPDVPGFSAAADHLPDLLERATAALVELLGATPDVRYRLAANQEKLTEGASLADGEPPGVNALYVAA